VERGDEEEEERYRTTGTDPARAGTQHCTAGLAIAEGRTCVPPRERCREAIEAIARRVGGESDKIRKRWDPDRKTKRDTDLLMEDLDANSAETR
jgi:hypothetical protein